MNETNVKVSFNNSVTNAKKLDKYAEKLKEIYSLLEAIDKGKLAQLGEFNVTLTKVKANTQSINRDTNKFSKSLSSAFNVGKIVLYSKAISRLVNSMNNLAQKSSDYIENVNLLEVAYANINKQTGEFNEDIEVTSARIEKLINNMSEIYGFDESRLSRSFGIFKQMANAMELPSETAENLSELMVKMSNDISSLYNIDLKRAENALQSALAGQVRPIRTATGADITEKTLQKTVDAIGLNTSISQLNYVEKRLIMIISLTDQLKQSQGDYGRTIESVANQTRIMHEQWERLSRAVGNVFYPILEKVLPYINAVLMVLTEIFNIVASLLGFKMPKFDYTGLASASDASLDLEENLDGAGASADKLKKKLSGLRSFDKLNVITTPKDNSSGVGAGGINSKILDAFNASFGNYNDMMEEVKLKANDIRDKIMEWLGFQQEINEEGEKSWVFKKITTGTILSSLAVGGTVVKGVGTIVKALQKIGFLKFPIISKLVSLVTGKDDTSNTLNTAGNIASTANSNASKLKLPSVKTILQGLADVALIIGGCTAILIAIGAIAQIPGVADIVSSGIDLTVDVFWGLAKIAIPLAGMSALIGVMGSFGVQQFAMGLADLAIIIGGCTAVVIAVGALTSIPNFKDFISTGIDSMQKVFNGIASVILPLATISTALGIAGIAGGAGVSAILVGLADLALVIGGVEVVLIALGALNQIPGLEWLMDEGMNVLLKIGGFLGKFVGSIVGGLVEGATSMLPKFGSDLSAFMENARPFFENASLIDANTTQGIENLAGALLKLTGANILDKLTSWFAGSASLTKFGEDLATFGPLFAQYANSVKNVDTKVVTASATSAKSMAEFTKQIPNKGGLISLFTGENTVSDFGEDLAKFGPNFKKYADEIKNIDASVVSASAISGEALTKFAEKIPNKGGLVSLFTGDNTLSDFGSDLAFFGQFFKIYAESVKDIDTSVVDKSADSASALAEFAKLVPNKGGLVSLFTGDNKLSDFGRDLTLFGAHLYNYYQTIKDVDSNKIDSISKSVASLVNSAVEIKKNGVKSTLKDFGSELRTSASDMKTAFETNLSEANGKTIGQKFGSAIANAISTAIKAIQMPTFKLSGLGGQTLATFKISANANGGMPPVGQLFIANEKGPELVGNIGGKSFVANQNQMMDLLDKKIGNAQKSTGTQVINLYLDADHKIGSYTMEQLQNMAKTDGKPITIG